MSPPRRVVDPAWAVLGGAVAGVLLAVVHRPRAGMFLVAATLAVGAVARLVLRQRDAGSLAVRNREIDVVTMLVLAAAIGVLAAVSPLKA
jgi:hypothetical protein